MPLLSRVEPDVLSFVAGATDLSVLVVTEGVSESFTEWRDGRRELQALVRFLGVDAR
jgi:hypothetical protein